MVAMLMLLLYSSCGAVATPAQSSAGLAPESSITIYIRERELALYICASTHFTNC